METKVLAVFQHGILVPEEPLDLPEGTKVEVTLRDLASMPTHVHEPLPQLNGEQSKPVPSHITPPVVTDPEERARRLKALVERMASNPLPLNAPRFTREELHERR